MTEKLLPHYSEGEKAILGACLTENSILPEVIGTISEQDFYHSANRALFRVIVRLAKKGLTVDWVTVTAALKEHGLLEQIGGVTYLCELSDSFHSASHWDSYAQTLKKRTALRKTIASATEILSTCYAGDADPDKINKLFQEAAFGLVSASKKAKRLRPFSEILIETRAELQNKEKKTGIFSGLPDLDRKLGGIRRKELVFIGGRPSMGKSALVTDYALGALKNTPVAFFSLEMGDKELCWRVLSKKSKIDLQKFRRDEIQDCEWGAIDVASEEAYEYPLLIDDSGTLTVSDIRAKLKRAEATTGLDIGLVVVDYLQLMDAEKKHDGEVTKIGEITRELKKLAKDEDVCVVCLSQLNRDLEKRDFRNHQRRPRMSDLRASGNIEQDADIIIGLYRPEVYPEGKNDSDYKGYAEAVILKVRNGPLDIVKLRWTPETATFYCAVPDYREDQRTQTYMDRM